MFKDSLITQEAEKNALFALFASFALFALELSKSANALRY